MASVPLPPLTAISVQKQLLKHNARFSSLSSSFQAKAARRSIWCHARKEVENERPEQAYGGKKKNYYELLGISVDSEPLEIKSAYRKLQKKYHPDITGQQGHEYTLLLNEAYSILMEKNSRKEYDASIAQRRVGFGKNSSGLVHSSWNGPQREEALFVDENHCIGCRECVHYASRTFMMDETVGSARVKVQYGDDDQNIEVAFDSCPVNCIHWVKTEELPVLELLIRPQPKEGCGVFGQGWERPPNVFMAAEAYNKQMKNKSGQ